ncbi:hypothetical protein [Paucimonas lemoignei]|nr:hypothetical protein [Paucimonas lemoignei]
MSMGDLVADLKASLHDAGEVFVAAGDMERLLKVSALDFNGYRPRTLLGKLTVEAGRMAYPAPDDCYLFKSSLWGIAPAVRAKPWEKQWPGRLPDVRMIDGAAGKELHLTPEPSAHQVAVLGSEFRFYYFGNHVIGDTADKTTIHPGDRFLLLLRAQAEAMRELMIRNIKKPVQLRDGLQSAPKNMTPAAWYERLMAEWAEKMQRQGV